MIIDNPKRRLGVNKYSMSVVPACVMAEVGVAMQEGVSKYGAFNYREVSIEATTYYDAVSRHLMAWYEGEDIDVESGLNHITKAISSLVVMRDSMMNGNMVDNRPSPAKQGWQDNLNRKVKDLNERHNKVNIEC